MHGSEGPWSLSYAAHLTSGCGCHWSATGEMACPKDTKGVSGGGSMMQKKHDLLFTTPSSDFESLEDDGYHAYVLHQDPTPVTFEHAPETRRYRNALQVNYMPFDKKQMKRAASREGCGFCGNGGGEKTKDVKNDTTEGFSPVVEYSDAAPF